MLKQFKNGGALVIDRSHKSLYRTPISCMEYFNSFSLMGFALIFFTNYDFLMGLPTYKNFSYMSPVIMWLILVGLLQQQTIKLNSFIGISI